MEKSEKLEGKCPSCPRIYLIRDDGRMRYHGQDGHGSPPCAGAWGTAEWIRPYQPKKQRIKR